jgi:hypothetical protein
MAKGVLFTYAVLYHPKVIKDTAGNDIQSKSTILVAPTSILVTSEAEARISASRSIPEEYLDKLEQVEIVIRPL